MALDSSIFETRSLKEGLKKSKKKQMRFGFAKGKKADSHKLAIDEKLQPKKLFDFAKANAETNAATYGTLDTDQDNLLTVRYERKCDGLIKALRQILKMVQYGAWDIRLIGPDGEEELDQGEKTGDVVTEEKAGTGPETDGQDPRIRAALEAAFKKLGKPLKEGLESGSVKQRKALMLLLERYNTAMKGDDFAAAKKAMDQIGTVLEVKAPSGEAETGAGAAEAKDAIAAGTVEKRKFLVTRWQQIPGEMKVEIDGLLAEVTTQAADEDPKELCGAIDEALKAFVDELRSEIDGALDDDINAGDPRYATTTTVITQLKDRVRGHELIKILKRNPMTPGDRFEGALIKALDEVGTKMAA